MVVVLLAVLCGCSTVASFTAEKFGQAKRAILVGRLNKACEAQQKLQVALQSAREQFESLVKFEGENGQKQSDRMAAALARCEARAEDVPVRIAEVDRAGQNLFREWKSASEKHPDEMYRRDGGAKRRNTKRDYNQMIQIVERVCGICSMLHSMCYCQGIEEMMGIEAPRRARMLRVVWSELHRLHSHLLWLGLFADSFGFESLFMQFWKIREKVMDLNEATTGNRVIVSVNVVGGVRADLDEGQIRWIKDTLGPQTYISLMSQYYPLYQAQRYPMVARPIRKEEYEEVIDFALDQGFQNIFGQDMESASLFIPDFDKEEPFDRLLKV
jgi:hypothetical protein